MYICCKAENKIEIIWSPNISWTKHNQKQLVALEYKRSSQEKCVAGRKDTYSQTLLFHGVVITILLSMFHVDMGQLHSIIQQSANNLVLCFYFLCMLVWMSVWLTPIIAMEELKARESWTVKQSLIALVPKLVYFFTEFLAK